MKTTRNLLTLILGAGLSTNICHADADLPVPYYWQDGAGWCWAASATMIARYYANTSGARQIKPWNSAALIKKGKDDGGNANDVKKVLATYLPNTVFPSINWSGNDADQEAIKKKMIKSLDSGHPVYLGMSSRGHAIVLTGYSGDDWKSGKAFINDPSGYSYPKMIHSQTSWAGLFDYIEKWTNTVYIPNTKIPIPNWLIDYLADNLTIVSAAAQTTRSGDALTIDLPSKGIYFKNGSYSGATIVSLKTSDVETESLGIEWNGADGFPGYFWNQGSTNKKKRQDLGTPTGFAFLDSDTLEFSPILNNVSNKVLTAKVDLEIFDEGDKKILSKTKNATVNARSFPGSENELFKIKVTEFHKPKKGDENKIIYYKVKLIATSSPSQDFVTVKFAVAPEFARHVVVVMDSSGSNTSTDPSNLRISAGKRTLDALTSEAQAKQLKVREDLAAVVDFDDSITVLSDFTDPPKAKPSLDLIDSSGGTDIATGIDTAVSLLESAGVLGTEENKKDKSAICLFTDGQNGDGPQPVVDSINLAASKGIRVHYGFLNPKSPFSKNARNAAAAVPKTPATIQEAVLASGGTYGEITDDVSQLAFVDQIVQAGITDGDPTSSRLLGHLFMTYNLPDPAKAAYHTFVGKKDEIVTIKFESSTFSSNVAVLDRDFIPLPQISGTQTEGATEIQVKLPRDGEFKVIILSSNDGSGTYRILADVENDLVIPGETLTKLEFDMIPLLKKQSGLFEQKVIVTAGDAAGIEVNGFRILITGLGKDVKVVNRSGVTADGTQFIESKQAIAPGDSSNLVIKYFVPSRKVPSPKLKLETF